MADFDIEGARKEGYSDSEIAEYLSKQRRFNLTGARREGYSDTEIISHLVGKKLEPMKMDPTEGMTGDEKFLAGAGKAMTDIARGAGQLFGMISRKDVDETNRLDAPLMQSGQGQAGYVTGGLATAAPAALIPGANTVAGSALVGAGMGALQPVGQDESRIKNIAIGGATGGAATAALKGVGVGVSKLFQRSAAKAAEKGSENVVRDATLKEARDAGYVVPGSATGERGVVGKAVESVAGKAALGQEASIRNQAVTNRIAKSEAGLGKNEPITDETLDAARERIAQPYREVAAVSPKAAQALEDMKAARSEAKLYHREYNATQRVASLKKAERLDAKANASEEVIIREAGNVASKGLKSDAAKAAAQASGTEKGMDLIARLKDARMRLAKNYDVERALNPGNGDVDAHYFGKILKQRGSKAVTGGLQTIGKFAKAFPDFSRAKPNTQVGPGIGALRPYAAALGLGIGAEQAHERLGLSPYMLGAAALPLMGGPARSLALSRIMQTAPSYAPSLTLRAANAAVPIAGRVLPPAISESVVQGEE